MAHQRSAGLCQPSSTSRRGLSLLLLLGISASCCQARLIPDGIQTALMKALGEKMMRSQGAHAGELVDKKIKPKHKPKPAEPKNWALLIAGSSGWWNYRHQSDVCHAYQILRTGIDPENIIVMVYDDIADSPNNPMPGKIINRPGGPDVYKGVVIDYKGESVNSDVFLAVLEGNKTAVKGMGSGKVIDSGPEDRVFVFYSDHGAVGVLGMPTGNFMYADQLHATLQRKHKKGGFKEMTLYIEACESGSMFEGLLGTDLSIYATTAANAEESSWGTYCPGMDPSSDEIVDTCLGDLYSVSWMEDSECEDPTEETLKEQFKIVRARTSDNFTYGMGSHAMQYGDLTIQKEYLAKYLGRHSTSACMRPVAEPSPWSNGPSKGGHRHRMKQRDADLAPLHVAVARAKTAEQAEKAQAALDAEVTRRQRIDAGLQAATEQLLVMQDVGHIMMTNLGWSVGRVFQALGLTKGSNALRPQGFYVSQLLDSPMGRIPGSGKPAVDSWDCLRDMVAAYTDVCGPMDQYSMKHTRLFANLCNAGVNAHGLKAGLVGSKACAKEAASIAVAAS